MKFWRIWYPCLLTLLLAFMLYRSFPGLLSGWYREQYGISALTCSTELQKQFIYWRNILMPFYIILPCLISFLVMRLISKKLTERHVMPYSLGLIFINYVFYYAVNVITFLTLLIFLPFIETLSDICK